MQRKPEALCERLKRLRLEKNLSAKEMARLIEVPQSTYREWEYGRGLRVPPFAKISQVFAISVTELVTGETLDPRGLLVDLENIEQKLRELKAKVASTI